MKHLYIPLTLFSLLLFSCSEKTELQQTEVAQENKETEKNPFLGSWKQRNGDNTVKFISQGETILFQDGDQNYKATYETNRSLIVDMSQFGMGQVVFEYLADSDSISALDDTFSRVE